MCDWYFWFLVFHLRKKSKWHRYMQEKSIFSSVATMTTPDTNLLFSLHLFTSSSPPTVIKVLLRWSLFLSTFWSLLKFHLLRLFFIPNTSPFIIISNREDSRVAYIRMFYLIVEVKFQASTFACSSICTQLIFGQWGGGLEMPTPPPLGNLHITFNSPQT